MITAARQPVTGQERADSASSDQPTLSLVVAGRQPGPVLAKRLEDLITATKKYPTEVIVICEAPWKTAPSGVRVVVTDRSASRGQQLDKGSQEARGKLIAFVDADTHLRAGWQERAVELLRNPAIGAVGGPLLLQGHGTAGQRAAWLIISSALGSGPFRYRFRKSGMTRDVPEMPTTNLVVKRQAFTAVGGFQCPTPLGEDARLCYKLRTLLGLRVVCDSGLAVDSLPPALPQPFLSLMLQWGRHRGDMWRRLPEASRLMPNALPAFAFLAGVILAGLSLLIPVARLSMALVAGAYILAGASMMTRAGEARAGILAAVGLPMTHLAYAVGFWRGYFGRSLGEISPGRSRPKALRILIFNWRDVTHPWAGGAESYMHELSRRWVRAGCDVGWIAERYRTGKRNEVIDGIRFYRVGGQLTLYPLAALLYLFRLRKRYDVIVDCENGIPFFTPLYSRKPVVLVVHHLHQEIFRREAPIHLRWLGLWLEGRLMPKCYKRRSVVTVSESTFADLKSSGFDVERMAIITNGVDLPRQDAYTQPDKTPLILCLGRLKPYKRIDVLLKAMPRILEKFPEASLAIVGQGPERERLERLSWSLGLAANVRFYGYLDGVGKKEMLSRAWLAVCTSSFEGWGVVCLEASANGVPVVASAVPGLRDAVRDQVTGVLVPLGDSDRLGQELISLLADPARRDVMGQLGRQWAAAHSWDRSAASFLALIAGLTSPAAITASAMESLSTVGQTE